MPTYVILYKFTDEGAKNIKGTVQRSRDNRRANEQRGVTVHNVYWTQGPYDLVCVMEAPDDESIAAAMLGVAALGNTRTTTLRAFNREEFEEIRAKVADQG